MSKNSILSLIVPTRNRPRQLHAFLDSVAKTVADTGSLEVVLVVDEDDFQSRQASLGPLSLKHVIVSPGLTMGALNTAGYKASSGKYLMLLNDDVICRTRHWDAKIRSCFQACPDDILLVHVNDTLMQMNLCTFPVVSRWFCDIVGGICPQEYIRYRIDDHIEDIFNLLGILGERRSIYLPNVIFEHQNYEERDAGIKQYFSDEQFLAQDAPTFENLLPSRKQAAIALRRYIEKKSTPQQHREWEHLLGTVADSFAIRVPERLRILDNFSDKSLRALARRIEYRLAEPMRNFVGKSNLSRKLQTARECFQQAGIMGLAKLIVRKTFRQLV